MVNQENSVVVVAAVRTPMGGMQGDFADVGATQLGAVSIAAAMARANVAAD